MNQHALDSLENLTPAFMFKGSCLESALLSMNGLSDRFNDGDIVYTTDTQRTFVKVGDRWELIAEPIDNLSESSYDSDKKIITDCKHCGALYL